MVSDTSSSSQSAWYPESKIVGVVMISFALFTPFLVYMSFDIWGTFEYTIDVTSSLTRGEPDEFRSPRLQLVAGPVYNM